MKYKACCEMSCMVNGCKTREAGGCHCVCLLKDREASILRCMENERPIWNEETKSFSLSQSEIDCLNRNLEKVRNKLKKYEVEE